MVKVEELQEKIKLLKKKVKEEKDPIKQRFLRKQLKRAQRKVRYLTGKKLAAKQRKKETPEAKGPTKPSS